MYTHNTFNICSKPFVDLSLPYVSYTGMALMLGCHRSKFAKVFGVRKLESLEHRAALFCVIRFGRIRLVTDRRPDTNTGAIADRAW